MSHPGFDGDFDARVRLAEREVCHVESEEVPGGAVGARDGGADVTRQPAVEGISSGTPKETPMRPTNKGRGFAKVNPAAVRLGILVLVLVLLWSAIIAIAVTAYQALF